MKEKLRDYQVIDVLCGGTFYKVRHKVTNNVFAWKAYDCSAYSSEQIQNIVNEVKLISKVPLESILRYYETILHTPSKTLYFVLEYNSWRTVQELFETCKATGKYIAESFIWYLLHELARVCKTIEKLSIIVVQKCITASNIFVSEKGELRINCFELKTSQEPLDAMRQVGDLVYTLCFRTSGYEVEVFRYSDELKDVVTFLVDDRNIAVRPDVVLHHPTVLANLENQLGRTCFNKILISIEYSDRTSEVNKCDSEKAVELCRTVEPLPRTLFNITDIPIYCNVSPKQKEIKESEVLSAPHGSLSPTLAALALELPGFVPRCRKPYTGTIQKYNCAQCISEETLSKEWMSRLVALRQREESLNKRERDLIAKEIVSSPSPKIIPFNSTLDLPCESASDGITLPPMMTQFKDDRRECFPRRRNRRAVSSGTKGRRKSYGYEDLDSSLSADPGDSSIIITATKFTKENMPRRNIFPDVSTKKVHFTSCNPFTESDDSVTLTFYELDNAGTDAPRKNALDKDIKKFKYLDLEKVTSEKRAAMQWSHSSPTKQAKICKKVLGGVTNVTSIRKTPSKTSFTSKGSNTSRFSMMSSRSHWSEDTSEKVSEGSVSDRTRSAMKQFLPQTPVATSELKKTKSRKSVLHFKTPFKFMTSAKD